MEQLTNNIKYELLNYQRYCRRIKEIISNPELQEMGLKYEVIGKTTFGYNIDCIKIGNGDKHLFIVGGTHGSELISVDYVTQVIEELTNMDNFDPNEFSLFFVPLHNPEGFIVTTSSLEGIEEDFTNKAKDYYLRYRMDDILTNVMKDIRSFISNNRWMDSKSFIRELKRFINGNRNIKNLYDNRAIPDISVLVTAINNINDNLSYMELRIILLSIFNRIYNELNNKEVKRINDIFFMELLTLLMVYFGNNDIWKSIIRGRLKLHQDIFKDVGFNNIGNEKLRNNIISMYDKYSHPMGSQVTFDANGMGVNLNANIPCNPGVEEFRKGIITYRSGARGNIKNHVPGPLGSSCQDAGCFNYTSENEALFSLINSSYEMGKYVGTLLFHGTGGLIYHLPPKDMNFETYEEYLVKNREFAQCYSNDTGYCLMPESDIMGYGDYLRGTFPNVLMIELSRMGGNPIAPYGDKVNIIRCFEGNYKALNTVLGYLSVQEESKKLVKC